MGRASIGVGKLKGLAGVGLELACLVWEEKPEETITCQDEKHVSQSASQSDYDVRRLPSKSA